MARTSFNPNHDGFAFVNSWTFNPSEKAEMKTALNQSIDGAFKSLPRSKASLASSSIGSTLRNWILQAMPDTYGMCGGMAYAALDYFRCGLPVPRGKSYMDHPNYDTPEGRLVRDYLWERQKQSFTINAPTLLGWMIMLHIDLPFVDDGPSWVLKKTIGEWKELKQYLDSGTPWPLCLIGTSRSPFDNHQVLAIGYDDPGDGTGTLYLYDSNAPDVVSVTKLDFRHEYLVAEESCPSPARGPLRGFFCGAYTPQIPPLIPSSLQRQV
jgi:hypothetical protein